MRLKNNWSRKDNVTEKVIERINRDLKEVAMKKKKQEI